MHTYIHTHMWFVCTHTLYEKQVHSETQKNGSLLKCRGMGVRVLSKIQRQEKKDVLLQDPNGKEG